jgi:hypothetical protein
MSRVLDQFPPIPPRQRPRTGRYDWDLYLDGRVHALTPAEFREPYTFRNAAHQMAGQRGIRIRTAMVDGEMIIQATTPQLKLAGHAR